MNKRHGPAPSKVTANDSVQGEGDYSSDRRYRERTEQFLKSADVDDLARTAAPRSKAEADEMARAEREGMAHARLAKRSKTATHRRTDR